MNIFNKMIVVIGVVLLYVLFVLNNIVLGFGDYSQTLSEALMISIAPWSIIYAITAGATSSLKGIHTAWKLSAYLIFLGLVIGYLGAFGNELGVVLLYLNGVVLVLALCWVLIKLNKPIHDISSINDAGFVKKALVFTKIANYLICFQILYSVISGLILTNRYY